MEDKRRPPQRRDGGGGGRPQNRFRRFQKRKVCSFCVERIDVIDYKDVKRIRRFVTEQGKILPRRITGTCAQHQRRLTRAIKRARNIALLTFKAS
jgi:small subunit ribosomal protein S18